MSQICGWMRRAQGNLLVFFPRLSITCLEGLCRLRLLWPASSEDPLIQGLRAAFPEKNSWRLARCRREFLVAQTRYSAAQRRLELLNAKQLAKEVRSTRVQGSAFLESALTEETGVILASPHYGAFMVGALWMALEYEAREVGFFYNDTERNPYAAKTDELLMRINPRCVRLRSDRKGVIGAMRILKRGGILCIMPDQLTPEGEFVYVPFFGRLFSVMQGTAFLSDKTKAKIIPAYAYEDSAKKIVLEFRPSIAAEFQPHFSDKERQHLMTEALFKDIEAKLRENFAPWRYWNQYAARTPCGTISSSHELQQQLLVLARHVKKSPIATLIIEKWSGYLQEAERAKKARSSLV